MRSHSLIVLLAAFLALGALPALGADLFVSPEGSGTYATIQDAVDEAAFGDVIYLLSGTFTGPGNRDVTIPESITIRSNDIVNPSVIDCEGSAADPHRGFEVVNGAPTIEHLIVRSGYAGFGGAIQINGGTATLNHCRFEDNTASQDGGGLYADSGEIVTMDHCVFGGNAAAGTGGAIGGAADTQFDLLSCTLFHNEAPAGSGVYLTGNAACALDNSIVAFGLGGAALDDYYGGGYTIACTDMYANRGGDWIGSFAGQETLNGNANVDPLFCDPMGDPANFALTANSPVGNGYACGPLGAKLPDVTWTAPVFGVAADGTGMYETIQAAHDAAPATAEIALEDGIYTGPGNRDLAWGDKLVSLFGRSMDATQVVLDSEGSAADPHRAMNIEFLITQTTRYIRYITFRNGYADGALGSDGGAILAAPGIWVYFENCRFENNTAASRGGAVASDSARYLGFNQCQFVDNSGLEALRSVDTSLTLLVRSCSFEGSNGHVTVSGNGFMGGAYVRYCQFSPGARPNLLIENCANDVVVQSCAMVGGHPFSAVEIVNSENTWIASSSLTPSTNSNAPSQVTAVKSSVHLVTCTFGVTVPGAQGSCAVFADSTALVLDTCSFSGYSQNSTYDGVVSLRGGSLEADGCTFSDNFLGILASGPVSPGFAVTNSTFEAVFSPSMKVAATTAPVLIDGCTFTHSGTAAEFDQVSDCSVLNTIIANNAYSGNPIVLMNSNGDIRNTSFTDNQAMYTGGAIGSYDSNLNLDGCDFLRNHTDSSLGGGALGQTGGYTSITNCTLSDNTSRTQGGAIRVDGGTISVHTSSLTGNQSLTEGGAILGLGSIVSLEGCTLENNTGSQGGAVHVQAGEFTDQGSSFLNNTATWGGGISGFQNGISLGSSTVMGNDSYSYGGVYLNQCNPAVLNHCLIAGNTTSDRGSGVDAFACDPAIVHCTISGNGGAGSTAQVVLEGACDATIDASIIAFATVGSAVDLTSPEWATLVVSCSDLYGNAGGDWVGDLAGMDAANDNQSANPAFCDEAGGDYQLAAGSVCAAANNPCAADIGALGVGCAYASPVTEEGELPRTFALLGNTPNPFNPRTEIRFELSTGGPVLVDVYDLGGRRVRRLVDGEIRPAGRHQVTWNGADEAGRAQSSGVYLYQVTAEGRTLRGRMTMLR